jgi:hypothetical protein
MTKAKPNSPGIDEDSTLHEEVLNSCITLLVDHQQNKEQRTNKNTHTHTHTQIPEVAATSRTVVFSPCLCLCLDPANAMTCSTSHAAHSARRNIKPNNFLSFPS